MLSEQAISAVTHWIHHVHEGVRILRKRRSIDHYLKDLGHLLNKVLRTGPLLHVDVAESALDFYWNRIVGVFVRIELTMDQGLI